MHNTGEPAHGRDAACFLDGVARHQFLFRKPPRKVSEYRRVLDEDLAIDTERRDFAARVDLLIVRGSLLPLGEQDRRAL